MKQFFLNLLFVLIAISAVAQNFVEVSNSFTSVSERCFWFDYDNDNDLDLFMVGRYNFSGGCVADIHINNGGTFTESTQVGNLLEIYWGGANLCDYNNDGYIDIYISGVNGNSQIVANLFKNNGDGTYSETSDVFQPLRLCSPNFADLDNDGDEDLFICGHNGNSEVSEIYINNNGNFELTNINNITPVFGATSCIVDIDNDGDKDIGISGWKMGDGYHCEFFINDKFEFTESNIEMTGLAAGGIKSHDYDADGDMDIITTGSSYPDIPTSIIYDNQGDGTFTQSPNVIDNFRKQPVSFADVDNNGLSDIFIAGKEDDVEDDFNTRIYLNDGSLVSEDLEFVNLQIHGKAAWGDYDNDNDLDFIISGYSWYNGMQHKFYQNQTTNPNSLPQAPDNLQSVVDQNSVTLSWDNATDNETPQAGLTYNIYVGSSPENIDVVTPFSDIQTGFRKIVKIGNANLNTSMVINNLDNGTYYWSVQTIDNAYAGSEFSTEQTFTIAATNISNINTSDKINIYPNPSNGIFTIENLTGFQNLLGLEITDITGKTIPTMEHAPLQIDISNQPKGIYFIKIQTETGIYTEKIIIQ